MFDRIATFFEGTLDIIRYRTTLLRLSILDRLCGPFPETIADQARAREAERLRAAFPRVDFDDPERHVR